MSGNTKNNAIAPLGGMGLILILIALLLSSCASQPQTGDKPMPAETQSANENDTPMDAVAADQEPATATQAPEEEDLETVPQIASAPKIVEQCKNEPYVKYEKQARNSIKIGWEATKAQRFGVGFRDADEYKKWSQTHNDLFAKVSEACVALSACAKQNIDSKDKKCAAPAQRFDQWQKLAKRFVDKVKSAETTQPPTLCSLTPQADDPSECFNSVAEQIDLTCKSEICKETSVCLRSIYFLDDAINQAKLACGFVGQKLSDCRGYTEATSRRKAEFEQCMGLYNQIEVEILPVI